MQAVWCGAFPKFWSQMAPDYIAKSIWLLQEDNFRRIFFSLADFNSVLAISGEEVTILVWT